jgi:hypothetical protein
MRYGFLFRNRRAGAFNYSVGMSHALRALRDMA